ncbi:hypothetical protein I4U23_025129 [Adineta vaga]|nr:hypothetical protein I4U23_025129 [Adineta vaga]
MFTRSISMIEEAAYPLLHKRFIKRHHVKFVIRILVGLALAHLIGVQFRPSYAAVSSTRKHRLTKTTIKNEISTEGKSSTTITSWPSAQIKNCTEPTIKEFPDDLFSQSQRRHGAIFFHLLACIYTFTAIAIVVDEYFIAALDKLCSTLNLDEDVAGATFMAGGSSSPELFTALIGIFVAKGDVGVGTIVGSAVFNIVCVIGICGLFVNEAIRLTWWPLCRDSIYYSFSVLVLIICLSDSRITLFESVILLIMYAGYIMIMCNNQKLQRLIVQRWQVFQTFNAPEEPIINYAHTQKTYGMANNDQEYVREIGTLSRIPIDNLIAMSRVSMDFRTMIFKLMMTKHFQGRTRFQMAVRFVISQTKLRAGQGVIRPQKPMNERRFSFYQGRTASLLATDSNYNAWKNIPNHNYDPVGFAKWTFLAPIKILYHFTIPDCRDPRRSHWFPLTFAMAIFWLSVLTYFMVWMVTVIGYTFGIPDSIMGITFLAAGSSIPDALSSVLVVRQGLVDMGVSNTFGSNVFDLLIGLALPWFFKTLISGEAVHINSNGLMYDSVLLLGIVAVTVLSIHGRKWYLDKFLGSFFLAVYGIFVIFSLLIEMNVFGFVNPPMCRT